MRSGHDNKRRKEAVTDMRGGRGRESREGWMARLRRETARSVSVFAWLFQHNDKNNKTKAVRVSNRRITTLTSVIAAIQSVPCYPVCRIIAPISPATVSLHTPSPAVSPSIQPWMPQLRASCSRAGWVPASVSTRHRRLSPRRRRPTLHKYS